MKQWVIPPKQNAAFVADMERVLALYGEPYDPAYPVVCLDERPCARSDGGGSSPEVVRELAEEVYPGAERIRLVCNQLNTHTAAAFYARYRPEQARRLAPSGSSSCIRRCMAVGSTWSRRS